VLDLQIDYILKLVQPVLEQEVSSFEVTPEATDAYNTRIQGRISRSVFPHCLSWYRKGGDGKVTSIFPGPGLLFWWWLRQPNWNHYKAVGAERWARQMHLAGNRRLLQRLVGLAVFGGIFTWCYRGL
jgi:hypothetical protein